MKKKVIAAGLASIGIMAGVVGYYALAPGSQPPDSATRLEQPEPQPDFQRVTDYTDLERSPLVSDRIIVHFTEEGDLFAAASQPDGHAAVEGVINAALQKHEATVRIRTQLTDFGEGFYQLELAAQQLDREKMNAILADLATIPGIAGSEEDLLMQPLMQPNDAMLSQQWSLQPHQPGVASIDAMGAWQQEVQTPPVIAILDTGITHHSDLAANVLPGYNFISDPDIAGNGVGRSNDATDLGDAVTVADRANPRFAQCPTRASSWHGTHVAGIAAAVGNNGSGIAGVSFDSKILPVRVLGKCGGYMSDIASAILWAAGLPVTGVPANPNPAKVINMSLGGSGSCGVLLSAAMLRANNAGALVVAAAGNENRNANQVAPANCPNVMSIAATNRAGDRAAYSNFGSVTLAAPGGDSTGMILSTYNSGAVAPGAETYAMLQGTSMATPHVAGLAALVFGANPALTNTQVRSALLRTATPFAAGTACATNKNCGAGIINASAAVEDAANFKINLFADRVRAEQYWVPKLPAELTLTLGNSGTAPFAGDLAIQVYLSTNYVYNPQDNPVLVGEATPAVNLAASRGKAVVRVPVTIPESIPDGAYYLVTRIAAGEAAVEEQSQQDNEIEQAIEVVRPQFTMTVKRKSDQAPSAMRIVVEPSNPKLNSMTRSWKYEWNTPEALTVQQDLGRELRAQMNQPGEASVSINVASANGEYSQTISQTIATTEPAPYEAQLKVRSSNRFQRAPLSLIVTPEIKGGHPEDRVVSQVMSVGEGATSQETNRSRGLFLNLPAGEHTIRYQATTRHGKQIEQTTTVAVAPNIPPICELLNKPGAQSVWFIGQCTDDDGRIKSYSWTVNGEPRQSSSYRIIVPNDLAINGKIEVTMTGYDDSGDGHTVTQTVFID